MVLNELHFLSHLSAAFVWLGRLVEMMRDKPNLIFMTYLLENVNLLSFCYHCLPSNMLVARLVNVIYDEMKKKKKENLF